MDKTLTHTPMTDESTDWKAAALDCLNKIEKANQRMAERQKRIETLKAETRAILNTLKVA